MREDGPFFRNLTRGVRRRLWLRRDGIKILDYVVAVEVEVEGVWKQVVRFDTSHSGPHMDAEHPDGRKRKFPVPGLFDITTGYKDQVQRATQNIEHDWRRYIKRYLEGKWPR